MEILGEWGYIGLFIGTFLAATIIPFSSEFLIIGVLVAGANPVASFFVATIGNWLGGLTSYWLGYVGKWEWIEKWLRVSREKLERQKHKIERYGAMIAFMSWAPFVGDVFAIGLGFYRIKFVKAALFMLFGKAVRFALWVILFVIYGKDVVLMIDSWFV